MPKKHKSVGKDTIKARQFIEELLRRGRYTFTAEEARQAIKGSKVSTYFALYRLTKAGWLVSPKAGFYVIVDPQHRSLQSLPPEWFIHDLMKYLETPYYVGLLSAAQIHGAAHQSPREFQVVVPVEKRAIRPIRVGRIRIHFIGKGPFKKSETVDVKTPTGFIKVSTPETTAWDAVRYPHAAGGFDNVVTLLSELAEKLDAGKLQKTIKNHDESFVTQRLGYILDHVGKSNLTKGLKAQAADAPFRYLDPSMPNGKGVKDKKWHLLVNAEVAPEA